MLPRRALGLLVVAAAGCSGGSQLGLHYLLDGIDPTEVVRVETVVGVDPADPREFFADQPYRSVADGIGYEVRDLDGSSQRKMLITFDATIGYQFTSKFDFTLLPPSGEAAPPLIITATAFGNTNDTIGAIMPIQTKFPGSVNVDLKDTRCGGQACNGQGQACCSNVCADTTTDVANCGGCNLACGLSGDSCSGQHCRCAGASGCSGGASCCPGLGCLDLLADNFNCGACGKACNPGELCVAGACTCNGGAACPSAPDAVCCAGSGCASGGCLCAGASCDVPSTCCGGTSCVDLSSDQQNCGSCGKACTGSLTCVGGACQCRGIVCTGADSCCDSGCKNLMDDPANCGTCGKSCSAGELCVGGQCQCGTMPCMSNQACCNSQCTTTDSDAQNCGACGNICNPGEQCAGGSCSCSLANGTTIDCVGNQTCCSDGCFDLASDNGHCGSCTAGCASGFACMMGHCVQTSCIPACSQGNTCVGTTCQCNGSGACAAPKQCCTNGCADLSSNNGNCGSCQHACNPNETCVGGNCLRPDGAMCTAQNQCLNGHCVDGYCCGSACTAECMACNVPGSLGACTPVPVNGTDPRGICMMTAMSTCGTDGKCDGSGNCQPWPNGTPCGAAVCNSKTNTFTPAPLCENGHCLGVAAMTCAPYVCASATACFKNCSSGGNECVPPTCSTADPAVLVTTKCTAGTAQLGTCQPVQMSCKPYQCNPNASPNACYSGSCAAILGGSGICTDQMICSSGCSCQIQALCLSSACGGC
jgi:hypothetical protein